MQNKDYYAVRLKNGEYYTRRGSGAPALFLTEKKAHMTLDQWPLYRDEGYTVVRFREINYSKTESYLVDNNWAQQLESMIGKFEVAPTPYAALVWELVKKYPDQYEIAFSYVETADGSKELVGLSLVNTFGNKKPSVEG